VTDEDLINLRKGFNSEFYTLFNEGMRMYIEGYWEDARIAFQNAE
jgi:hypothetical protein